MKNETINSTTENQNADTSKFLSGELIRQKRIQMGLSLRDLETMTGVSSSYINKLENSLRANPTFETLLKISKALNLDLNRFFTKTNEDDKKDIVYFIKGGPITFKETDINSNIKSILGDLVYYILNCTWDNTSKIDDIKNILDLIDKLKKNTHD
ncbi:helix-turn-helix domain-containing protein [Clostridium hydrogenum]|uniref:helix-turn-helix domain-containing protein n=1 Tax=Clostridium hydrogenum TaxID=2855764 RepID=UPI001F30775B|nr:helix-turn-helix transcriptional regulator [Clostridium hydrogenum]